MMHPTKSHLATPKGIATQPVFSWQESKILFDQLLEVNIVVAV
jgi:hypothetical protein